MLNLALQEVLGWFSEVRKVNTNIQAWRMDVSDTSGRLTRRHVCKRTKLVGGQEEAQRHVYFFSCYKIKKPEASDFVPHLLFDASNRNDEGRVCRSHSAHIKCLIISYLL